MTKNGKQKLIAITALVVCIAAAGGGYMIRRNANKELKQNIISAIKADTNSNENDNSDNSKQYPFYTVLGDEPLIMKQAPDDNSEEINSVYPGSIVEFITQTENGYALIRGKGSSISGYVDANMLQESDFVYSFDPLFAINTDSSIYSYDEMMNDIAEIDEKYDCFTSDIIGTTADNRSIPRISIGNPNAPKKLLMYGAANGTDYMAAQLLMQQAEYYACFMNEGIYNGFKYSDLFDQIRLDIIPMVNPDGVSISQWGYGIIQNSEMSELVKHTFYTDKESNRTKSVQTVYYNQWKSNGNGVDITLNFPDGFENVNDIKTPSAYGWRGSSALSEKESKAIADLMERESYSAVIGYTAEGNSLKYISDTGNNEADAYSKYFAETMSKKTKYSLNPVSSSVSYNGTLLLYSARRGIPAIEIGLSENSAPLPLDDLGMQWTLLRESPVMAMSELLIPFETATPEPTSPTYNNSTRRRR